MGLRPIHHIALWVHDLLAMELFYTTVLALPLERRWTNADGTVRSVWLQLDGGALLMLEKAPHDATASKNDLGWRLLAFSIAKDQRQEFEERLQQYDVPITGRSAFTLYFSDIEGNRLGLSHWPERYDKDKPDVR